ncbi:MAG: hypothetical protein AB1567_03985 [bacterium]
MILELQDKKTLSEIRMSKAYEFLEDAKANYNEGRYKIFRAVRLEYNKDSCISF